MTGFIPVTILTEQDAVVSQHTLAGQPLAPGLAITPAVHNDTFTGGWTVTHTLSGRAVASVHPCLDCLKTAARHLTDAGIDWMRGMESLITDEAVKDAARKFGRATQHCDGQTCAVVYEAAVA